MLMKRRSFPSSPLICVASAGKVWAISASRPGRFSAAESNCFLPAVWRVKAVGSVTLIAMDLVSSCCSKLRFSNPVELAKIRVKISQSRTNGALLLIVSCKCIGRLEAVSGDAAYGDLVRRDAPVRVEPCCYGSRDASSRLSEDAFGLGQFLNA